MSLQWSHLCVFLGTDPSVISLPSPSLPSLYFLVSHPVLPFRSLLHSPRLRTWHLLALNSIFYIGFTYKAFPLSLLFLIVTYINSWLYKVIITSKHIDIATQTFWESIYINEKHNRSSFKPHSLPWGYIVPCKCFHLSSCQITFLSLQQLPLPLSKSSQFP